MSQCVIYKQEVDYSEVVEEFEYLFQQVDRFGVPSLTEYE